MHRNAHKCTQTPTRRHTCKQEHVHTAGSHPHACMHTHAHAYRLAYTHDGHKSTRHAPVITRDQRCLDAPQTMGTRMHRRCACAPPRRTDAPSRCINAPHEHGRANELQKAPALTKIICYHGRANAPQAHGRTVRQSAPTHRFLATHRPPMMPGEKLCPPCAPLPPPSTHTPPRYPTKGKLHVLPRTL